jgi:predicted NBD/HSP70 family sugar kinase
MILTQFDLVSSHLIDVVDEEERTLKNRNGTGVISGTNLEHARSHNRRAVLEAVRVAGALSRADIARQTSLSIQTISNIVSELETSGLLIAGETNRTKRGQPSVPYSINPAGACSIGLHIARHHVFGVIIDLTGTVLAECEQDADATSPEAALPIVQSILKSLLKKSKADPGKVLGVGMALPARFGLGVLSTAGPTGLPDWNDQERREKFASQLSFPVIIENDAVTAAIGEHHYGAARGINNFVLLYIEEGLGAGLFLNGQPFKGALSNAGEIGHMIVDPGGRPCPCGNKGCLERYISVQAHREFVASGTTTSWAKEVAPKLATAINILETVLDTELIIVGGIVKPELVSDLIGACNPLPVSASARANRTHPRLVAGSVGAKATALGAAALPIFDEMNPRFDVLLKPLIP